MEISLIIKAALIFTGIIGAILLLAQLLRRWHASGRLPFLAQNMGAIRILEQVSIDHQRRVVILHDTAQEYVLLLGPHQDLVLSARLRGENQS